MVPPPGLEEFLTCRVCGAEVVLLSWNHLALHGMTGDQYKKKFGEDYLASPLRRWKIAASLRRKRSKGQILPRSREEMIRDLRRHAREIGATLTLKWLKKRDPNLIRQSIEVLGGGGWRNVLKAAGLKGLGREDWTRERILEWIRGRASKGAALSNDAVAKQAYRLYLAAFYYFGSWSRAVEAAGQNYDQHRLVHKSRTREDVVADLRAWVKVNGPLSYKALRESDRSLCRAAIRDFGSVRQVARRLGLRYEAPERKLKWTRERIVEVMLARLRDRQSLSVGSILRDEGGLYQAAIRYWGSWKAVRAAAETASRSGKHGGDTR